MWRHGSDARDLGNLIIVSPHSGCSTTSFRIQMHKCKLQIHQKYTNTNTQLQIHQYIIVSPDSGCSPTTARRAGQEMKLEIDLERDRILIEKPFLRRPGWAPKCLGSIARRGRRGKLERVRFFLYILYSEPEKQTIKNRMQGFLACTTKDPTKEELPPFTCF